MLNPEWLHRERAGLCPIPNVTNVSKNCLQISVSDLGAYCDRIEAIRYVVLPINFAPTHPHWKSDRSSAPNCATLFYALSIEPWSLHYTHRFRKNCNEYTEPLKMYCSGSSEHRGAATHTRQTHAKMNAKNAQLVVV